MSSTQVQVKAQFEKDLPPPGGLCLSSFLVVRNGKKILLGRMVKDDAWVTKFLAHPDRVAHHIGKFQLPGRHLWYYESPDTAARWVAKEQLWLNVPADQVKFKVVQSHSREPNLHWDLCFVYELTLDDKTAKSLKTPPWFSDFRWYDPSEVFVEDFGRSHGDVLEALGMIKRKAPAPAPTTH